MTAPRLFPNSYISTIVQDVLDVCQNLTTPPKNAKRPEEHVSKQLYRLLLRNPRYQDGPLEPHFESWLPDLSNRPDIRFSCGQGVYTYFLFEAKRLFVTFPRGKKDSLIPEYIEQGMMRFVAGRYAPDLHAGAMLGYVFMAVLAEAREKVQDAVSSHSSKLCLVTPMQASALPVTPQVDESLHTVKGKPFTLYHLLVPVSANRGKRPCPH